MQTQTVWGSDLNGYIEAAVLCFSVCPLATGPTYANSISFDVWFREGGEIAELGPVISNTLDKNQ